MIDVRRDRAILLKRGDLILGFSADAQFAARCIERSFGGAQIVLRNGKLRFRKLQFFQRRRLAVEQYTLPRLNRLREIELRLSLVQRGDRRDEVVLRLQDFRAVDFHQRIARLDDVADLGQQFQHAPGKLRQYRRTQVVVECNLADGGFVRLEWRVLDGDDCELVHLVRLDPNALAAFDVERLAFGGLAILGRPVDFIGHLCFGVGHAREGRRGHHNG